MSEDLGKVTVISYQRHLSEIIGEKSKDYPCFNEQSIKDLMSNYRGYIITDYDQVIDCPFTVTVKNAKDGLIEISMDLTKADEEIKQHYKAIGIIEK